MRAIALALSVSLVLTSPGFAAWSGVVKIVVPGKGANTNIAAPKTIPSLGNALPRISALSFTAPVPQIMASASPEGQPKAPQAAKTDAPLESLKTAAASADAAVGKPEDLSDGQAKDAVDFTSKVRTANDISGVPAVFGSIGGLPVSLAPSRSGSLFAKTRALAREAREIVIGDSALAPILKPHWKLMAVPIVLLVVDGILNIGMSNFIPPLFTEGNLSATKAKLWTYGSLITAGFAAYVFNEWKHNTVGQILKYKLARDFRNALVKNTLMQEIGFLQKKENNSGALAKRIRKDTGELATKSTEIQLSLPHYLFYGLAGAAGIAAITLAKPLLLIMPVLGISGAIFLKKGKNLSEEQSNLTAAITQSAQEAFRYISLVRVSGATKAEEARYALKSEELSRTEKALVRLEANFSLFNSTLTRLVINFVFLAGALIIAKSGGAALTVGSLFKLTFLAGFLQYAFTGMGSRILAYSKARGASKEARELILRKAEMTDAADAKEVGKEISVRFEEVSFSYAGENDAAPVPVLHKLSFEVPAGKTVAFVGSKGSGKSTIMDLVLRLRDAGSGRVLINGEDIRGLDSASLRNRIAVVDQRPRLFKGSIGYNVKYGSEEASDEEVERAVTLAGADWVRNRERFPEGLDTDVGDFGARLSGGQRQSLVIARAILKKPSLYILDEATEAMDNKSERDIQAALEHAIAGDGKTKPTTVMIAHRLTTVRNADLIYVLDKGQIAESGTHEQLLAKGGRYAALWKEGGYDAETSAAGQLASGAAAFSLAAAVSKLSLVLTATTALAAPGLFLGAIFATIGLGFTIAAIRVSSAMAKHLASIEISGPRGPSRFFEPIATKAQDSPAVRFLPNRIRAFIDLHEAAHRDRNEGEILATLRQVRGIFTLLGQEARALQAGAKRFYGKLKIMALGDGAIRPILAPYRGRIVAGALLLSLTAILSVAGVRWVGNFVDLAVLASKGTFAAHSEALTILGAKASSALLLSAWLNRKTDVLVGDLLIDAKWLLSRRLFNNLLRRDMKYHMNESAAGLAGRLSDEVEKLARKNVTVRLPLLQNALTLAASLYVMVNTSFLLSLPVLIMVPALGYLGGKFAQKTNQLSYESSQISKEVTLRSQEIFEMAKVIKIFNREGAEARRFSTVAEKFFELGTRLAKASVNAFVFQSSLGDFFTKYMLYILGVAVGVSSGHIMTMVALAGIAQGAFTTLAAKWTEFQQTHGETAVIRDMLTARPEVVDAPDAAALPQGPREIKFEDVSFSYDGNPNANIVTGISFTVKPGERVALVGSKGSGKSTLLRLMQRLFEPQKGRILVDGADIKSVTRDSLASEMAVVSQDDQFFDESIEYNMLYGASQDVTQEDLHAIVKDVAPFFLNTAPGTAFPEGLKTRVGEGASRLSGGQRRLIAIVRAALRKPRILLLDEATSALDKTTEQVVLTAIGKIRGGPNGDEKPTIIEVAHNLPTIMNAERIIALDGHGQIQESGTHRELMALGGLYRSLWDAGLSQRPTTP